MSFRDRTDAGRQLADHVVRLRLTDAAVSAWPRGGLPVAFEVAQALEAPLEIVVVRKLRSPVDADVSIGAVTEGGLGYVHPLRAVACGASPEEIEAIAEFEMREVERHVELWRGAWPPYPADN